MPMEERVSFGKKINVVKAEIEAKITEKTGIGNQTAE